jgi:mono/diheme cytochrome c family protein
MVAMLVVVSAAAGCSGSDSDGDTAVEDPTSTEAATAAGEAPRGEALFAEHCAACHGPSGAGGIAPSLVGIADRLTLDAQLAIVRDGRGRMPAFGESISEDDVAAIVEYTREALDG